MAAKRKVEVFSADCAPRNCCAGRGNDEQLLRVAGLGKAL